MKIRYIIMLYCVLVVITAGVLFGVIKIAQGSKGKTPLAKQEPKDTAHFIKTIEVISFEREECRYQLKACEDALHLTRVKKTLKIKN